MKWWISGLNVTVNLPISVGFSLISNGLRYEPGTLRNTRHVGLNYQSGIGIKAFVIFSENFTAQGDILVGNSWYHVQGN